MREGKPPFNPPGKYPATVLQKSDSHIEREVIMKRDLDKIQFEYRTEIRELMKVVDKYVKQNPKEKDNKTLERFFDLLDVMDMEW